MAATISQQPQATNGAYVPNVWVLDGLTTEDRYVLNVLINGTIVSTIKQPANPAGVGIFDVSKILQSYLEPGFVELTQFFASTPGSYMSYQIQYGTETGTSVTIDGTSITKFVINATDNWRTLNMDLSDFIPVPVAQLCENSNITARYASPYSFLTNYPGDYTVRSNEYKTLSFFAKVDVGGTNFGPNAAPFFAHVEYYNGLTKVLEVVFTIGSGYGSDIRTNCQDMTVNLTNDNSITTMGVGPQNFADAGITPPAHDRYEIHIHAYNNCVNTTIADCQDFSEILADGYLGDIIYEASFTIDDSCEKFEPVTVSFMNQYGVKDYFDFTKRNTSITNTSRNNYTKVNGTWSSSSFSINQHGRGKTVFSSDATTSVTISTDWMEDNISEWLEELYISPSVQLYIDGQWEPCVITQALYEEKTYARNQLFQHVITVEYANNQKIQRG